MFDCVLRFYPPPTTTTSSPARKQAPVDKSMRRYRAVHEQSMYVSAQTFSQSLFFFGNKRTDRPSHRDTQMHLKTLSHKSQCSLVNFGRYYATSPFVLYWNDLFATLCCTSFLQPILSILGPLLCSPLTVQCPFFLAREGLDGDALR